MAVYPYIAVTVGGSDDEYDKITSATSKGGGINSGSAGCVEVDVTIAEPNQSNWKKCDNVEVVLMGAPKEYPRGNSRERRIIRSELITTRDTTDGGGTCYITANSNAALVPGYNLYIGVYGKKSDGTIIRTTDFALVSSVTEGADPDAAGGGDITASRAETLAAEIDKKLDGTGYDGNSEFGYMPVVNAGGTLRVRPVEFAVVDGELVLRGSASQVIASIPLTELKT